MHDLGVTFSIHEDFDEGDDAEDYYEDLEQDFRRKMKDIAKNTNSDNSSLASAIIDCSHNVTDSSCKQ